MFLVFLLRPQQQQCIPVQIIFLISLLLFVFFSVWFNSDLRLDFATIPRLVSVNLMLSVDFGGPITFLFGSNI